MSVPALRFKEFNEEWSIKRLNDIAEKIGDGLHSTPEYDEEGQYYFVNGNNLTNNKIEISENTKRVNAEEYLKHKVDLTAQSVLISINGTIGNLAFFNDEKVVLGKSACYINLKKNENKHYVFNLFQTANLTSHFDKELTGSTIKNLSLTTIKNTKAFFPSFQEQTKIANFLTAVDEKITQLTQKHDLLTQYKKGVMQQIFSQELRFKDDDGQDFPEWEEVSLDNVLDYEQPTKYLVSSTEYSDSFKTPVLTAGKTFILGYTDETNGICKEGLPVIIFDDFTTAFKFVSFPFKAKSSAMKLLRKKADVNIYYVYSAMQVIDFLSGDEHKRYWISEYSKVIIPLPCEKEQTKIANFLTAVDNKIIATQTQLQAVKQYKQGLLQQMFV